MFIDKKKHKDGVTVTIKLACYKGMVAATEYSEIFSESVQSAHQKRQQSLVILITHAKIINYISADLSAEMMSTQNDGMVSVDRIVDSDLGSSLKCFSNINTIFSC